MKEEKVENIIEEQAQEELEKRENEAKELLNNPDKLEEFLQNLENKLKVIPKVGDKFAMVPTMISLVRSYVKKEYTKIPLGTIVAIVGALIYIFAPLDAIADAIPIAGFADDALVVAACLKLVEHDVKEYEKWREENNK